MKIVIGKYLIVFMTDYILVSIRKRIPMKMHKI